MALLTDIAEPTRSEDSSQTFVSIRPATPEDAPECGQICFDAFSTINRAHNYPPDFPSPEIGVGLLRMMFSHPGFYSVVAECGGRIVGSNCLDERSSIAGVGPITVAPSFQNRKVGAVLMRAVLDRARERQYPGVRLLQAAFHNRSLSLYTKLGFDAREPISVMQGQPPKQTAERATVRQAQLEDLDEMNRLCERVHGHNRSGEVRDAIQQARARLVQRDGRITGYATTVGFFGQAVGEDNTDLQALISCAEHLAGPGILVPTRNSELFRWCLRQGLRVMYPMTLMTMGFYEEPRGAYLPSVSF